MMWKNLLLVLVTQGIADTTDTIDTATNGSTTNDTPNESQEVEFPDCLTASTIPTPPCLLNIPSIETHIETQ